MPRPPAIAVGAWLALALSACAGQPDVASPQLNEPPSGDERLTAYQINLNTCLSTKYREVCNHKILTPADAERVRLAEYQANLEACLGISPGTCERWSLSLQDGARVDAFQAQAAAKAAAAKAKAASAKTRVKK